MKTLLAPVWAVLSSLATISLSSAVTILNDGFEESTHALGYRTVAQAGGSPYYLSGNQTDGSIVTDSTFGSKALTVAGASTINLQIISPIGGTISLGAVNDSLTLSFKVRIANYADATGGNTAFRFGIHSSGGTAVSADGFGQVAPITDDVGYGVISSVKAAAPTAGNVFFNEAAGNDTILGGGGRTFLTGGPAGFAIMDNASHTFSLTLTRTSATAIGFSLSMDGGTAITHSTTNTIRTSFDEITFSTGYETTPVKFAIDDVLLTATNFAPIPEPSLAGLAGLGLLSLLKRRR